MSNNLNRWQYRDIFEKAEVGIALNNPETGTVGEVNDRYAELIGYSRDELREMTIEAISADDPSFDQAAAMEKIQLALDGEPQQFDWLFERKDGSTFWGEVALKQTSIGGNDRLLAFVRDVSERKRQERKLQEYQTLVEAVGDPMYVLDSDGYIQMVNDAVVGLTGAPTDELIGSHVSEFMSEGDAERGASLIRELLTNSGRTWDTFEITIEPVTGDPFPAEVNLGLIQDDDGDLAGSAGVVRDLTEHKARERQLERQNERLDEFAGIASHDLRNPLNVASGRLEIARNDCESHHLETVARSLERMEVLIDDMLSLARAGETISDTQSIELKGFAVECWQTVDTVQASLEPKVTRTVEADESRLRQLLENLMRNAVEHGGEQVTVTIGDLDDGFYIEDDGKGIPETHQEKIFEPSYSSSEDGTGFGLSIVQQIAEAHGWQVTVTDGNESGARFEVTGLEAE